MAWIFDTYSMNKGHSVLGVVTGKPLSIGGSLGRPRRRRAARSTASARRSGSGTRRSRARRVAVQGFGNVGRYLAQFLEEEGAKVVASPTRAAGCSTRTASRSRRCSRTSRRREA